MTDSSQQPKWRKFEKLAYDIQKELVGDADVKFDDSILGVDSKVGRQVDISIRKQVGPYPILIVIDCKDLSARLDVKDVEAFAGLVKDVRANRGALIVSSGFSEAALTVARNHGIDAFRLVDTESVDWKSYVAIPCLLDRTFLHSYSFQFGSVGMLHWEIPINQQELMALEFSLPDGTPMGTLEAIIRRKWDKAQMPREAGHHTVLLADHLITKFRGIESHQKITAFAHVQQRFYYGPLPVKLRGLQDMHTGGLITRTLTTGSIEPKKLETGENKDWKQIADPSQLAILKPAITLSYFDCYSDDVEPDKPQSSTAESQHED